MPCISTSARPEGVWRSCGRGFSAREGVAEGRWIGTDGILKDSMEKCYGSEGSNGVANFVVVVVVVLRKAIPASKGTRRAEFWWGRARNKSPQITEWYRIYETRQLRL